jgi:parvulin-like peptidyl-prolyl isomerase
MLTWIREKFGKTIIGLIVGLLALVFVFYGVFNPKTGRDVGVAGTVNGDPITMAEYDRAYKRQLEMFKNMMGGANLSDAQLRQFRIGEGVFNDLVRQRIMVQEAEKQGNVPSDEEVRDQIRQIPAFQLAGKFDLNAYKATLDQNSYTPASFETMLRQDLAVQRWQNYFKNRVNVSNDEVKVQFLSSQNKRNIKFVLLTNMAGKHDVKVAPEDVQKYLADATKMNLVKSQFEAEKNKQFKGKNFDDVKDVIASDLIATSRVDEIKKANDRLAAEVLPMLTAEKSSDVKIDKLLKPYGVQVKTTGLVEADTQYLPGLGEAKDLMADAFADKSPINPSEGGKAKIYKSAAWSAIALVTEVEKPDLSKLESQRPLLMRTITSRKEKDLFDAWMKKMVDKSKIVANPSVINGDAGT